MSEVSHHIHMLPSRGVDRHRNRIHYHKHSFQSSHPCMPPELLAARPLLRGRTRADVRYMLLCNFMARPATRHPSMSLWDPFCIISRSLQVPGSPIIGIDNQISWLRVLVPVLEVHERLYTLAYWTIGRLSSHTHFMPDGNPAPHDLARPEALISRNNL